MKVLIAEYTAVHDPALAPEGKAMVSALKKSFEACGHTIVMPSGRDFDAEISRLAPECDYGLVIAPDEYLAKYTHTLELATHNIGSDSMPLPFVRANVSPPSFLRRSASMFRLKSQLTFRANV